MGKSISSVHCLHFGHLDLSSEKSFPTGMSMMMDKPTVVPELKQDISYGCNKLASSELRTAIWLQFRVKKLKWKIQTSVISRDARDQSKAMREADEPALFISLSCCILDTCAGDGEDLLVQLCHQREN